jgi:hypothetical protein
MTKSMAALLLLAFTAGSLVLFPARVLADPADDVQVAMGLLQYKAASLGTPRVQGEEAVAGKAVPALYLGTTKMNNNFGLVDDVQKEVGGTATIFVRNCDRNCDEFVRVTTNVKQDDGSRALGTILDPKGQAFAAITQGESYFGEANILGKPYVTGYVPIRNVNDHLIGIYYVGYLKNQ